MIRLKCPAKVNLNLRIAGRRKDGYHLLDSLVAPIDWFDYLNLEAADSLNFECSFTRQGRLPLGEDNLVMRAARALAAYAGIRRPGAAIQLQKNLPIGAGLGGGSSNAAACLRGLNQLWQLGLADDELRVIALSLGADIPFFIRPRPARLRGVGEQLTPVELKPLTLLLLVPQVHCDTAHVYKTYAAHARERNPSPQLTCRPAGVPFPPLSEACNHLTPAVLAAYPQLGELLGELERLTANQPEGGDWRFSGSGSCLYRPCVSAQEADELAERAERTGARLAASARVVTTLHAWRQGE